MPNPHSGANRLVLSEDEKKKASEQKLAADLLNANEVAARATKEALKSKKK